MGVELIAGAAHYAAVTPSDTTDLGPVRALYVGGAGNVAISNSASGANAVTFTAAAAGSLLALPCRRVMSTNTTATAIVALY